MRTGPIRSEITRSLPPAFFIAPLLFYWVYSLWINPSKNYYINDAEFPYFVNSLAVFKGGTYRYVDHPGTPVEIIGSIILGLTFPFLTNTPNGFVFHHLQDPGLFFSLTNYFLILAHLACMMIFLFTARSSSSSKNTTLSVALAAMYFAIHTDSLNASMIWNHNTFSFPFGTLLSLYLFKTLHKQAHTKTGIPVMSLVGLGIGAGILASFTIYLLAWLAGILTAIGLYYLLIRKPFLQMLAAMAVIGFSGVLGFFLATLPVLSILPVFFRWVSRIFTHKSNYLAVPEDEATQTRIYGNSIKLFDTQPALFLATMIVIVLGITALIIRDGKISGNAGIWSIIGGLTVQTGLLLFILLDRPSRDAYFLSLAATLPVLLLAILRIYERRRKVFKFLALGLSGLILSGVMITTAEAISTHREEVSSLAETEMIVFKSINDYSRIANREPGQIVVLWTHDSYSACWGLRLGNLKAGKIFTRELEIICPNQYQLNNDLRAVLPDHSYQLNELNWDIIFTCEKWVKKLYEYNPFLVVQLQTGVEWACGNMAVVYKDQIP